MLRGILGMGLVLLAGPAAAVEFQFEGYGDIRLVAPPATGAYLDGELGKLRYGDDDGAFQPGDFVETGRALITRGLFATATARMNAQYGPAVDLLEADLQYSPSSSGDWIWSARAGAFFPPISLENEQIGWSSFWTITPSAINSWIGEEVRIVGAEATLKWRRANGDITLTGAVFGRNDPAGVMIADRGWTFDDRVSGLFDRSRLPDATAINLGLTPPIYADLFTEMDGRPGWYLDLSWEPAAIGSFEIMRYDNNADPAVVKGGQVAWHTSFWDVGFEKQIGKHTLLGQGISGSTTIEPSPFFHQTTDFKSAYALAGYDMDGWWAAARFDVFQMRTHASLPSTLNEDGRAFTVSLSWLPEKWLRLTGELLSVNDRRDERVVVGEARHQIETQFQFLARVYF